MGECHGKTFVIVLIQRRC